MQPFLCNNIRHNPRFDRSNLFLYAAAQSIKLFGLSKIYHVIAGHQMSDIGANPSFFQLQFTKLMLKFADIIDFNHIFAVPVFKKPK